MPSAGTYIRQWKTPQDAQRYAGRMSDAEYEQYYNQNFGTPSVNNTAIGGTLTGPYANIHPGPFGPKTGAPTIQPVTQPGTLPGTAPQPGVGPYGAVPTVPDPKKSVADYISGWKENMPAYTELIKAINDEANRQAKANLEANLPGYGANQAQLSANIGDLLSGKISQSTINNMATAAAERGIVTGGGPNANAAYLRALGLTTEGLKAQGAQQFAQQIAQTPLGKQIDWATFTSLANEQQQWEYLASVLRASPDPAAAAALNMMMAQAGQRTGYGAGGGISNPSIGAGQAAASNWLANLTNSLWSGSGGGSSGDPVDAIIKKYMPSAPQTAAPSISEPGFGYVPGFGGGVSNSRTGEVPFEWTGTPSGLPYSNVEYTPPPGDIFQQTADDYFNDWETAYLFGG